MLLGNYYHCIEKFYSKFKVANILIGKFQDA